MNAVQAGEFAVVVDAWFDGEDLHGGGPATFTVRGGRVAEVAAGDFGAALAARGTEVVRGGFLLPGLVDAHVHLFLDGAPTDGAQRSAHMKKPVEELVAAARASARQSLDCGVTLVRDAGDRHGINHLVRGEAAAARSDLSRVRSAGIGIKRPRRYGAFIARDVEDDASIRESVAASARDSDEIKVVLTGIIDFEAGAVTDEPQFDLAGARLAVETARACGRKTLFHCSGAAGLEIAARAGAGSIEHGFFMSRPVLELMLENDVAWTPTFCPVHFQWAHPEAAGWSAQTVGNLRRILDEHARHLLLAHELGVTLLLGTDAGSMGVEHGHAVFDEIERYREAGLRTVDVLRAATASARRHFGASHPRLGRGAPFDALLLERSPFDDLRALRGPRRVWRQADDRR